MPLESPTLAQEAETPLTPHEALTQALGKSGMPYTAFAYHILGVSPSSVWRWMNGRAIPDTVQARLTYYLTQEDDK